ncbi:aerotolerance regulator BatA [Desulfosarcina ovata subsp. sediminis]|uniref:Aerotolerance regulator BatA n=1 Tax=Desulfosarcina ovata subsp. sediminis TaxID=885957 RepID=A0A5K7ZUB6_9BACT|nr:VWA domain-containing protein [Desulfosarcina ovata]BBO83825.1 aerotolerance regulator BatA [Desulfosarcina ovata subsp. sediminis]
MLRFASPWCFLLLLLIPLLAGYRHRRHRPPTMASSALFPLARVPMSTALRLRPLVPAIKYAALVLMIVALARPQWGTERTEVLTEGINIVLALDLSESMAALDFKKQGRMVNRLEAVKGVVQEFVAGRSGDRIGMVVFGTHAYTQLPLTRDYNTLVSILDRLTIGAAGERTAIGDAIGISLKRLSDIKSKSNIIILLTDGQSNAGELSPETAGEIAREKGVKIYTIGVGTRGKAPFLVKDPLFGERYVYQRVSIDEDTLKAVAEKTGGLYFRAENLAGLQEVYATIDKLEKTEVKVDIFADYSEIYPWLLVPAILLLPLYIVLRNTRYLVVP